MLPFLQTSHQYLAFRIHSQNVIQPQKTNFNTWFNLIIVSISLTTSEFKINFHLYIGQALQSVVYRACYSFEGVFGISGVINWNKLKRDPVVVCVIEIAITKYLLVNVLTWITGKKFRLIISIDDETQISTEVESHILLIPGKSKPGDYWK